MLYGEVEGSTRSGLVAQATKIAATYYETPCVTIYLTDEGVHEELRTLNRECITRTFSAQFTAEIGHRMNHPRSGFASCATCGLSEWP